ncbi:MAG: hypothetical protein J7639_28115, partial [Paenibacillaceae bacterium]|nr:hypothetical protein [Paenibacillaceae bacterium]
MDRQQRSGYYVAPEGDDRNDGLTPEASFRTIGRAASLMQAGDTCYIREGVYRETVKPAHSGTAAAPIRFEAYAGEQAVVSGCDLVTNWKRCDNTSAVYQGEMDWNMADGNGNVVFVNGELYHEAQWPHPTDRLDLASYAVVDRAAHADGESTIFDEDLTAFPDGYWDGAIVACVHGVGYFISTALVTRFAEGTLYHEPWISSAAAYRTQAGDRYFLTRSRQALNGRKVWHYDPQERQLYLAMEEGSDPRQTEVEAKRREYAFDLRGLAHVEVIGIDCRAASITTERAHHCLIAGSRMIGLDRNFGSRQTIYGRTKGLELGGHDNELRDSEICCFEGIGVHVEGRRNKVVNCYIHDGNWEASYASLVKLTGSEHLVSHNTITRAGRTCVSGVFARSVIQYNDISFANCLVKDSG